MFTHCNNITYFAMPTMTVKEAQTITLYVVSNNRFI